MPKRKNTKKHREWRKKILKRDEFTCVVCDGEYTINTHMLNAHHIHDYSHYPEIRYDMNNGACLCQDCHIHFHCDYKKSFRYKCDMDDFLNFLSLMNYAKSIFKD